MASKRKSPPHTNASSGEESRADPVPSRSKEQRREDEEVENEKGGGNESSGDSESESRSNEEGVKHKPAKPLQLTKSSSDSCHESNPEGGIRAVESVAAIEEGAPVKKLARYQQLKKQPAERARKEGDAEGEEEPSGASEAEPDNEAAKHETLKPSQPKKPSLGSESSSKSKSEDENHAVEAVAASNEVTRVMKRPKKKARNGSDANGGARPATLRTVEGSARFQRLWSEKDEIRLLRSMIKFRKKKDLEPSTNVPVFKDFLDKRLVRFDFPANESHFQNKMRKMKNKFVKGCEAGCNWKKPHDQKLYELSHALWGGVKKSQTPKPADEIPIAPSKSPEELENRDWADKSSLLQLTSMGLDEEVLRIGGAMIDSSQMEELKERWRQLRLSELQVANDRSALMNHQAKLYMDAYHRAKRHV